MAQTLRSVARQPGDSFSEGDIRARLESFRDARLMVEMDGHYLSLTVWAQPRCARVSGECLGEAGLSGIAIVPQCDLINLLERRRFRTKSPALENLYLCFKRT